MPKTNRTTHDSENPTSQKRHERDHRRGRGGVGVDRAKTSKEFRGIWDTQSFGKSVFRPARISGHHIWIDKLMISTVGILMSNELHAALVAAGITGVSFERFEKRNRVSVRFGAYRVREVSVLVDMVKWLRKLSTR